jgi:HEAT repeat protein
MSKLDNKTYHVDLPLISMLPIARLCDYALRTLPRCSDKASINAIHRALADGDNLLKAHAVEALGEIKRNIKGKEPYAYIPPESFFNSEIHIPDENGEKVVFWDEVVVSIEEQGITKLLGRLTLDTSPVIEENLSAVLLKEEEKQWLEAVQTEQVDSEEIEALWHDFRQNLMDLWRLPLGYYGVQGLSEIRTPQAIQFLLSALDNPTPIIRAAATGALSSWLCDFPDSGWSRGGSETVRITSESERLRDVAVTKLIDLLHDDTILDMSVELSRISDLAARALKFSGRDAAKSALELWRRADT